jgi:hypothetical protein
MFATRPHPLSCRLWANFRLAHDLYAGDFQVATLGDRANFQYEVLCYALVAPQGNPQLHRLI